MVTIKDIARAASVSHPAVSAVLNGKARKARISKVTADRIRAAAHELGYKPNLQAKGLRSGKSFSVGILLPAPMDNFFAGMIGQLEQCLSRTSYTGVFAFWSDFSEIAAATESILKRDVDGIITVEPDALPDDLGIPVVSLFNQSANKPHNRVVLDRCRQYEIIVEYLYSLGHRRIAKTDCHIDSVQTNKLFAEVLERYGLSNQWMFCQAPQKLTHKTVSPEYGNSLLTHLMDFAERPTAVVMPNDLSAIALIAAAWRRGLQVPDELSVIGSDDIPIGVHMIPPLTTCSFGNEEELAQQLVDLLIEGMENDSTTHREVKIQPKLVIRGSCGAVRPYFGGY